MQSYYNSNASQQQQQPSHDPQQQQYGYQSQRIPSASGNNRFSSAYGNVGGALLKPAPSPPPSRVPSSQSQSQSQSQQQQHTQSQMNGIATTLNGQPYIHHQPHTSPSPYSHHHTQATSPYNQQQQQQQQNDGILNLGKQSAYNVNVNLTPSTNASTSTSSLSTSISSGSSTSSFPLNFASVAAGLNPHSTSSSESSLPRVFDANEFPALSQQANSAAMQIGEKALSTTGNAGIASGSSSTGISEIDDFPALTSTSVSSAPSGSGSSSNIPTSSHSTHLSASDSELRRSQQVQQQQQATARGPVGAPNAYMNNSNAYRQQPTAVSQPIQTQHSQAPSYQLQQLQSQIGHQSGNSSQVTGNSSQISGQQHQHFNHVGNNHQGIFSITAPSPSSSQQTHQQHAQLQHSHSQLQSQHQSSNESSFMHPSSPSSLQEQSQQLQHQLSMQTQPPSLQPQSSTTSQGSSVSQSHTPSSTTSSTRTLSSAIQRAGSGKLSSGSGSSSVDKYGMLGLLNVIRMTDLDLNTLALGTDLTTLGLNLNTSDMLYSTFAWPLAENPSRMDPDYVLPACYYQQPPPLKTSHLSKFTLETLFYIFYNMPADTLQLYAARELYAREWRYHKELKLWFTRSPKDDKFIQYAQQSPQNTDTLYIYFNLHTWERDRFRDIHLLNNIKDFMSEAELSFNAEQ